MWPEIQTIRMTYQRIVQGERPWTALGDFLNYWFAYAPDSRFDMVKEPLEVPDEVTLEYHQWAVFCAATVEYLCKQHNIPCPDWVFNSNYALAEPWFMGLGAQKPQVQTRLRLETPEQFARRNIYCGNRMFANKYELAEQARRRAAIPR